MGSLLPIYTAENIKVAYQLDWSLTLFWHKPPQSDAWLEELKETTETDGVRILQHRFARPDCSLFLVSTRPEVVPIEISRSVKGRLQHLVRKTWPKAFQRNYDLRSIGSTIRSKLDEYVAKQLEHHLAAEPQTQEILADFQIHHPEVNLSKARFTSHARYWCNLHVVFINDWRWRELRRELLVSVQDMIQRASTAKSHLLARAGILADHVHLLLGTRLEESPLDVGLSYMNNVAYVYGMKPTLKYSCFLGTFGDYDLGAVA
jgi:hypothetical protein